MQALRCRWEWWTLPFLGRNVLIAVGIGSEFQETGLCLTLVLGVSLPRKLSYFQFFAGLQFGQTFPKMLSTHVAQNVHS